MKLIIFFFTGLLYSSSILSGIHSNDEILLPRLRIIAEALLDKDSVIVIGRSKPVNINEIVEIKNDYGDTLSAFHGMMMKDKDIEQLNGSISHRYTDSVLKGGIDSSWFILYEEPYSGVKDVNDLFRDVHGGYWLYILLPIEVEKNALPRFIKPRIDRDVDIISSKDFFREKLFFKSFFHEGRSIIRVMLDDAVDCPYKSEISIEHAMLGLDETDEIISFIKMVAHGGEIDYGFVQTPAGKKLVEFYLSMAIDGN